MSERKVLCPVDFSPCSSVAFEHAVEIAKSRNAKVVALHVESPPPSFVSGFAGYGAMPPYNPEPDSRLEKVQVPDGSVELERVHLVGFEGETIVRFAEKAGCELVVMGTHGHGSLAKLLLGSVADFVLRHAKCPVIIVKDRTSESVPNPELAKAES